MTSHQAFQQEERIRPILSLIPNLEHDISPNPSKLPKKNPNNLLLFAIGIIFIVAGWKGLDFLELTETGKIVISKARQKKLDKALDDLSEAEQYALIVTKQGRFPCYSCPDSTMIKLFPGEVWRYGVTTKGVAGRYPKGLPFLSLEFRTQFVETIQDCFMEERRKIYHYAALPENLKRKRPIIRPPGNKQDN